MYDVYLLKLYLLDDTFDIRGPKELLPVEKLTIRVAEPLNIQDLNRFVLHYSICPVVHEIQVIWYSQNKEPPHVTEENSKLYTSMYNEYNKKVQLYILWPDRRSAAAAAGALRSCYLW